MSTRTLAQRVEQVAQAASRAKARTDREDGLDPDTRAFLAAMDRIGAGYGELAAMTHYVHATDAGLREAAWQEICVQYPKLAAILVAHGFTDASAFAKAGTDGDSVPENPR